MRVLGTQCSLVVHGAVTDDMSFSTLLPIPKGKNANGTVSSNCHAIALSSGFGKIFDRIVMIRYEGVLELLNYSLDSKRIIQQLCAVLYFVKLLNIITIIKELFSVQCSMLRRPLIEFSIANCSESSLIENYLVRFLLNYTRHSKLMCY